MLLLCRYTKDRLNSVPARYKKFVKPKIYDPTNKASTAVILANEQNPRTAQGQNRRLAMFKAAVQQLYTVIADTCDRLGLKLNKKKTHIVRARRGFTFLKVRYAVTETGRIIRQIAKFSIVRMRRKLKKFRKKVDEGLMSLQDVFISFMSWYGTVAKIAKTYRQRKRMLNLYNRLFHQYKTGGMIA